MVDNVSDLDAERPEFGRKPVSTYLPTVSLTDVSTRKWISYLLLILLSGVVIAAFYSLFIINSTGPVPSPAADNAIASDALADDDRLMRLMNLVFGPLVTLFSSVVGFYFGAKTANEVPPGAGGGKSGQ